jgi:hypothetical protein
MRTTKPQSSKQDEATANTRSFLSLNQMAIVDKFSPPGRNTVLAPPKDGKDKSFARGPRRFELHLTHVARH